MDITLVLEVILLVLIGGAAVEYSRRLRKAREEYMKAKEAVEDIVVSFNKQLNREAEQMERVAYKVEGLSSRSERALKSAEEAGKKTQNLEAKIANVAEDTGNMSARIGDIDKRLRDVVTSHEALAKAVDSVKTQITQFSAMPEVNVEAVIPIRRDKALAPLTETELAVLEMLASDGSKTAPEIKNNIKLSREHTARLMKKLYESGYLERDTGKIPFRYSVKKEMENLLKKKESETTAA